MEDYRHQLLQHNLTLLIYWESRHHILDCTLGLDDVLLTIIRPLNQSIHSPTTLEWNWDPQSLSYSLHTLEATVTFLDGEVKRSWVEEFSLDLSASNHVEIPKNVEEHVRDLQFKQPVRCVCGQLLVLAAFLWFQHQSTKNPYNLGFLWTRLCLLYSVDSSSLCVEYALIGVWHLSVWKQSRGSICCFSMG